MAKYLKLVVLYFFLIGISVNDNFAEEQPLYYLGGSLYYNYNVHFPNFPRLGDIPNCCPKFSTGNGGGLSAALLFEYPFMRGLNLGAKLDYSILNGLLSKEEYIGNTEVFRNGIKTTTEVWVDHTIDSKISIIGLEPYISYKFFNVLNSNFGLKLAYQMNSTFSQKEKIIRPDNITFYPDNRIIRNEFNNIGIPGKNSLLFFGTFSLGYDFNFQKDWILTPEIIYTLPLNNLGKEDWKVASWKFGASLKIPIYPKKELPVIFDTTYVRDTTIISDYDINEEKLYIDDRNFDVEIIESEESILNHIIVTENYVLQMPKVYTLESNIEAYGITENGEKVKNPIIKIEELEYEEGFPLLTHIFFKSGDSKLNNTSMHLITADDVQNFDKKSLKWETLSLYQDLLNIIGIRMKQNPSAIITIIGCNSDMGIEANNLELSKARAESVRNYLKNIWSIDDSQMKLKWQNLPNIPGNRKEEDGIIENQRVEIYSNNVKIIKPLYFKEIIKKSNPPILAIYPSYKSEFDITDYHIKVSQDNNVIREFEGVQPPNEILWKIEEEPIPEKEKPITISFDITDENNRKTSDTTRLELEQLTIRKKRYELKDDKSIEKFSLILFDYDSYELKKQHIQVLDEIKKRIKSNSQVFIRGFTDRIGDPEYNKVLALRRSQKVRDYLGVSNDKVEINAIGADKLLFDNSTPQGRSYCRTVEIVIETPIK